MEANGYLVDENNDLIISGGSFLKGEVTLQNQKRLLLYSQGELKCFPLVGIGVIQYLLNDSSKDEFERVASKQLKDDGMLVQKCSVKSWDNIIINASYEETGSSR